MSTTPNDFDPDALISRLAGPLTPPNRAAFRAAAEDALAHLAHPGPGSIYRTLVPLQKLFFDPPSWEHHAPHKLRSSKLRDAPPIERAGRRER